MKSPVPPTADPTFEEAMASLEAIVARMESSDLPLEEVIDAYEKGSRLLGICEARIAAARRKVEKIASSGTSGVATESLGSEASQGGAPAGTDELF